MPSCPECTAKEKKRIKEKYEAETPEEQRSREELNKLYEKIEFPMKMDTRTKHFICVKCGLYATREEVGDIRARLNQREYTKADRQYEYQEWWQKSKKEKQQQ